MKLPASLAPMRHRDFAIVWAAGFVSNAGSWMQTVAVGAFVTARTGQASWAGLAAAAAFLPIGLLAPIGGALADRFDRRIFVMIASIFEAVMATLLAWMAATGRAHPGSVTVVVFVAGCIGALRLPFQQAMILDLVERDEFLAAASLGSAQYNFGRVFGPSLAAVVIAVWGYSWAFTVNAVSFFAVVAAMAVIRLPHIRSLDGTRLWERIRIGARATRANPGARAAITLMAVVAFLVSPFIALIPARAYQLAPHNAGRVAAITGWLTTAQGIGAVIGALAIAPLAARFGRRRMLLLNVVATPLALIAYAAVPSEAAAVALLGLVGALYIGVLSGLQNVVSLWAPVELRGRILSLYLVALGAIYPIGGLFQGWIADKIGLTETTTAGALALVAIVAVWRATRPTILHPLTDPDELGIDPENFASV
ncbi:MAG TPA: MFS transporter [Acidimicrobiales bacterium]|nr:MFS transporter [Acidimicrobiales bacterium]